MEWILDPQIWASLLALTALEIVLGIDNVIFISIISASLPPAQGERARRLGLTAALAIRIVLLAGIAWIVGLRAPIAEVFGFALSWRDALLLAGGLFLLGKGTREIHHSVDTGKDDKGAGGAESFGAVIMASV
jgi:predicted tellurium resistance membrane protein TerC